MKVVYALSLVCLFGLSACSLGNPGKINEATIAHADACTCGKASKDDCGCAACKADSKPGCNCAQEKDAGHNCSGH